ncbi:MAG: hypothetical protein EBX52_07985, partial [Proteobacteria bacterium]|nr:hypothetical protein [Pseudomonadota bacterium]
GIETVDGVDDTRYRDSGAIGSEGKDFRFMRMKLAAFAILIPLAASASSRDLTYCIPIRSISIDPFREIVDGRSVAAHFILTRPYLSQNGEAGILSAHEISPDGTVFTGRVNSAVTFNDGSPVTAYEAAYGIAHGILFRPIRERIRIDDSKFEHGIRILDERTFEVHLKSGIRNEAGVLREALSSGSAHNRMWPVKLDQGRYRPEAPVIAARYPYVHDHGDLVFTAAGSRIRMVGQDRCKGADFSLVFDALEAPVADYFRNPSRSTRLISVQTNSNRLGRERRSELIRWIRSAFKGLPERVATESVPSFFLEGEAGHEPARRWDEDFDPAVMRGRAWVLATENPAFEGILKEKAAKDRVRVRFVPFSGSRARYDARVMASAIHGTRHVILQDLLNWSESSILFAKAPGTLASLKRIMHDSAATIPPSGSVLSAFEGAALEEASFAPVARRRLQSYSKKGVPVQLVLGEYGEHVFVPVE